MTSTSRVEKFSHTDLSDLRTELLQSGLDTWQAGELVALFLAGRGYGVSKDQARDAVSRMEGARCDFECMQAELERVARVA